MSGTKDGGRLAAETNIKRYGEDFYRRIGAIGGKNGHTGGFASYKVGIDGLDGFQRASEAGRIGGARSKRGPNAKQRIVSEMENM